VNFEDITDILYCSSCYLFEKNKYIFNFRGMRFTGNFHVDFICWQ
jgi:hypothetical protein